MLQNTVTISGGDHQLRRVRAITAFRGERRYHLNL